MAARLVSQENTHPPLAAAVIDEGILFANQAAVGQPFKDAVIRRFVGMVFPIRMTVIAPRSLNPQQLFPFLFTCRHNALLSINVEIQ